MVDGVMPPTLKPSIPIAPAAFALAMQAFAPFESHPVIAVAVSGGPDSLALLLLIDRWTRERGGTAIALTIDHGLRPDSASEAAQVGAWATARGIPHAALPWAGEKPRSGIQDAARQARYRLLTEACAARGILHLALAHHADDQAETVLFRRERGSGPAGLAGMAASRSLGAVRMIRPLLGWPKSALTQTCRHFRQDFVEDPSNRSDRFARTNLRRRLADDKDLRRSLLTETGIAASRRADDDVRLAEALARIAEIRPDGLALLDRAAFLSAAADTRRAILAATLRTVGGNAFAPEADAVGRLDAALAVPDFAGASLAGCIVRSWQGRMLVCREPKRIAPPQPLAEGVWQRWDGRFMARASGANESLTIGALGSQFYTALRRGRDVPVPAVAGAGLPAIRLDGRVVAVPSIGWAESDCPEVELHYSPLWPLSSETFTVVSAGPDIMSE
jgi:tRNA(Ile)-lysidine synthase